MLENWQWHDDHMKLLTAEEASEVAGVMLDHEALYLQDSAQLNPASLCASYAGGAEIHPSIPHDMEGSLVFAIGIAVTEDPRGSYLPLHTVRGQIASIQASDLSKDLKCNLCYGGYLSASSDGKHICGSTFQKWLSHTDILEEDNHSIFESLFQNIPSLKAEYKILGARASLRTSARDRFPVAGVLCEGTYVSTGHGSHGIASSLASAHLIADQIRGGIRSLGKSTIEALSPSRFLSRSKT